MSSPPPVSIPKSVILNPCSTKPKILREKKSHIQIICLWLQWIFGSIGRSKRLNLHWNHFWRMEKNPYFSQLLPEKNPRSIYSPEERKLSLSITHTHTRTYSHKHSHTHFPSLPENMRENP